MHNTEPELLYELLDSTHHSNQEASIFTDIEDPDNWTSEQNARTPDNRQEESPDDVLRVHATSIATNGTLQEDPPRTCWSIFKAEFSLTKTTQDYGLDPSLARLNSGPCRRQLATALLRGTGLCDLQNGTITKGVASILEGVKIKLDDESKDQLHGEDEKKRCLELLFGKGFTANDLRIPDAWYHACQNKIGQYSTCLHNTLFEAIENPGNCDACGQPIPRGPGHSVSTSVPRPEWWGLLNATSPVATPLRPPPLPGSRTNAPP